MLKKMEGSKSKNAVAIKYSSDLPAPIIVASGKGALAEIIQNIARNHQIQILEDEVLVENLIEFKSGTFVPEEFYPIVAELLTFVSGLTIEK